MLKYKDKTFTNRREAKEFLGGTNAFSRLLKQGKISFINDKNIIANNEDRREL